MGRGPKPSAQQLALQQRQLDSMRREEKKLEQQRLSYDAKRKGYSLLSAPGKGLGSGMNQAAVAGLASQASSQAKGKKIALMGAIPGGK